MSRRKVLTWFLAGLPIALIGCIFFYVYIPNSAGFEAAAIAVRELPDVRSRVGEVQNVRVLPFRPFRERFVGSQRHVLLSLAVRGDRGEIKIRIRMIRRHNQWDIDYWRVLDS
jgi:hypothetical protein